MRLYSKSFLGNANDRGGAVVAVGLATDAAVSNMKEFKTELHVDNPCQAEGTRLQ